MRALGSYAPAPPRHTSRDLRALPALLEELRSGGEYDGPLAGGAHSPESWVGGDGDGAEEIVLARRVGADGRTRAYLNGRTAAVADLRRLGEGLLAFYGQHEHRKLTLAAAQLEILDGFCGPGQAARRAACAAAHGQVRELRERLEQLRELEGARERELDLLEHELAEIEQAEPQEGEPERLQAERERLRRLDALLAAAARRPRCWREAGTPIPPGSRVRARAPPRTWMPSRGWTPNWTRSPSEPARWRSRRGISRASCAGTVSGWRVKRRARRRERGAGGLQAVEERLALLERLQRKHGPTIAAVLEHGDRSRERHEQLLGAAVALEELTARLLTAQTALDEQVRDLRAARQAAAPRLAEAVCEQLVALAMPDAAFAVELSPREPGASGGDAVEFEIAPNPGVAAAPVREIASGGELSRVMLALMTVANTGSEATLVFDEVDAGIGGQTARAVGERLRDLAGVRQVVCITHLPQIASLAARHFSVVKDTSTDTTRASVHQLGEPEVLAELVRMLGAPERDVSARRHARELRKAA